MPEPRDHTDVSSSETHFGTDPLGGSPIVHARHRGARGAGETLAVSQQQDQRRAGSTAHGASLFRRNVYSTLSETGLYPRASCSHTYRVSFFE